ncbi:hypothetical protein [Gracilibacillus phocaeensis]|uniref:hypothetical protein n=1 Tax=Gracilibacillus phocaeensis TaxID=2042304 RepID=UPI00102FF9C1|nr:hypothetical protein [Gracilibacillus phocaeensis]
MSQQVSVFIMDVSNSSVEHIGNEISEYLAQIRGSLTEWTQYTVETRVSHRAGDELVVVCKGYATAYVLAFYISRIWKFTDHRPYFGLSFGDIETDVGTLNLETWIHPLMKQARQANDYLKNQANRNLFRFALPRSQAEQGYTVYHEQFESLINTSLTLKQEHLNGQTDVQSLVCSLYLILGQQNKVSQYLGRTTATISHHIKQGKTQVILQAFDDMVKVLGSLEETDKTFLMDKLQSNMKQQIRHHLDAYLPKEGSST